MEQGNQPQDDQVRDLHDRANELATNHQWQLENLPLGYLFRVTKYRPDGIEWSVEDDKGERLPEGDRALHKVQEYLRGAGPFVDLSAAKKQQRSENSRFFYHYDGASYNLQTLMDLPIWIEQRKRELFGTAEELAQECSNPEKAGETLAAAAMLDEVLEFMKSAGLPDEMFTDQ